MLQKLGILLTGENCAQMLVLKLYGPNSALRCTHNCQRFQGE